MISCSRRIKVIYQKKRNKGLIRPLFWAALSLVVFLVFLKAAGFSIWEPAEQKEVTKTIDLEKSVQVTGQIYQRVRKENSIQYYLKNTELLRLENSKIQEIIPIPLNHKLLITIAKEKEDTVYKVGSIVRVSGTLKHPAPPTNPGQFDSFAYYQSLGIGYTMFAEKTEVLRIQNKMPEKAQQLKETMEDDLLLMLPKRHAGVLIAMLLGDSGYEETETKINYQAGGVLHILSISGLHLSLLGMGCYRLFRRCALPTWIAALGAASVMIFYSWFTGNHVATLRALVMFIVNLGAKVFKRSYDPLSSLSLSLILLLIGNPQYLFYSGFQLSYAAVLGVSVIYPVWHTWIPKSVCAKNYHRKKYIRLFCDAILSGSIISLSTLPFVCRYFYEIPLLGIIPNLLILPTMNFVMIPGILGMAAGHFSLFAGRIILLPAWGILELYEIVMKAIRSIPGSVWICGQPQLWQMIVYYAAFFGVTCMLYVKKEKTNFIKIWSASAVIIAAALFTLTFRADKLDKITVLDVGQGDGIVIHGKDYCYLIDGGSTSEQKVGEYRILPFLKSQGIRDIDGIVLTHPDEDHMNGILELLKKVENQETALKIHHIFLPLWMKGDKESLPFIQFSRRQKITVSYLQKGDQICNGDLCMDVLHPDTGDYKEEPNAGCVTLGVHIREFDALLTGDLEGKGEEKISEDLNRFDYLKVGHHGSKNSSSEQFLDKVQPEVAVISCGRKNRYGHPHSELIDRLSERKIDIHTTPESGAVTVSLRKDCYYVHTFYPMCRTTPCLSCGERQE